MHWRSLSIFLLCCYFPLNSYADDYFIRLSSKGLVNKKNLLNHNLSQVSAQLGARDRSTFRFQNILHQSRFSSNFNSWLKISFQDQRAENLLAELYQQEIIDYHEPVNFFKINPLSNDSLIQEQWYLEKIKIAEAWKYTQGRSSIIIGVIDTGIDYHHPDLQGSLWLNEREINGLDNFDDDNNGFIDDLYGWDFTDAPRFADGGDFQHPDNDPMDEYGLGHGTQIAGIIAAQANNSIGICGIAPKLKVMNLRAGTSSGYLEEDDVANALLYALDNGAQIVNLSFGDVALSRFLRDVIYFAYQQGLILIASAGNNGDDQIHYPSGLPETMAVGASNKADHLAGFSSFGSTIDLVAPGQDIISTAIGGKYSSVSGTSFSAPIVSAIAGLILSINPQLDSERIRNILKTSADDILYTGWDLYSGAGRVSAGKALSVSNGGILKLITPPPNTSIAADKVWLIGTMIHPDLNKIEMHYGLGEEPQNWIEINQFKGRQILADTLGFINTGDWRDTTISIRLRLILNDGKIDEIHPLLKIDRSPPNLTNLNLITMYDGAGKSILISFETDDLTSAKIFLRESSSTSFRISREFGYEAKNHRLRLAADEFSGEYEYYLEIMNQSGLKTIADNNGNLYNFSLYNDHGPEEFSPLGWDVPKGYFLDGAVDLDHDGNMEIILSRYDDNHNFGPIEIYEFEKTGFIKRFETEFIAIPRAAGDVDGDGLSDLLVGFGQKSFLLESPTIDSYPNNLIWHDTTNFWAAGFTDLDADGKKEILGRIDSNYVLLEAVGDNAFAEISRLVNPSKGTNQFGTPQFEVFDLDKDSRDELILCDEDGDLLIYKNDGNNSFRFSTSSRTLHQNTSALISGAYFSEIPFIFAASHTSDQLNYEHEFDARYWSLQRFISEANPLNLVSADTLHFYGYQNLKEFDSSIRLEKFNDDLYLFCALYPNLHIFRIDQDSITLIWHRSEVRSNNILIADFDGDAVDEFYFNDGQVIRGYTASVRTRPAPPYSLTASPLDSARIHLKWPVVLGAGYYNIYRGEAKDNLSLLKTVQNPAFVDSGLVLYQQYFYAVTAVDSVYPIPESEQSKIDSARTSIPPKLLTAEFSNAKQVFLHFDQRIKLSQESGIQVFRRPKSQFATSILILKNQKSIFAGFAEDFAQAIPETLEVNNLFNLDEMPINPNYRSLVLTYFQEASEPYLQTYQIIDRYNIQLQFNESMRVEDLQNSQNYQVFPSGKVLDIELLDQAHTSVRLILSQDSRIGALGQENYLVLNNLHNLSGVLLKETSKIYLQDEISDLKQVIIYPQPLKPEHDFITFAKLPQNVEINIFSMNGERIKSIKQETFFGGISWYLKDENETRVSSGIYIYELIHAGKKKYGKLVLVR